MVGAPEMVSVMLDAEAAPDGRKPGMSRSNLFPLRRLLLTAASQRHGPSPEAKLLESDFAEVPICLGKTPQLK